MDEIHEARSAVGEAYAKAQAGDKVGAAQAGKRADDLATSAFERSVPAASADVHLLSSIISGVTIDIQTSASVFTDQTSTVAQMVSLGNQSIAVVDAAIAVADQVAVHGRDGSPGVCPEVVVPS